MSNNCYMLALQGVKILITPKPIGRVFDIYEGLYVISIIEGTRMKINFTNITQY